MPVMIMGMGDSVCSRGVCVAVGGGGCHMCWEGLMADSVCRGVLL